MWLMEVISDLCYGTDDCFDIQSEGVSVVAIGTGVYLATP